MRYRGIRLLGQLIEAGEKRAPITDLVAIKPNTLFGSMLEKKFVDTLREFVEEKKRTWRRTIIGGGQGFRFTLADTNRLWELELQPTLNVATA